MMKKIITPAVLVCLTVLGAVSCTKAFPNDDLDYMWRLDKVKYLSGYDFEGNIADEVDKEDIWFCFARCVIEIRDHASYGYAGIVTRHFETLNVSYSMYEDSEDYDYEKICSTLRNCGIYNPDTEFRIERLTSTQMILSDENCRLYFTRW